MRKVQLTMEVANLICRFGDSVLLDYADEVVLPSFLDSNLSREYAFVREFFHQVEKVVLDDNPSMPVLGIVGRLIKDTTLSREQIYEKDKGLVRSAKTLRSSPSSLFLLVLNNHRLIYVRETKDGPSKETFGSTLLSFLRQKHKGYLDQLYQAQIPTRSVTKKTRADLLEEHPKPSLDIIPLSSDQSIETFIKQYELLKVLEIKLSDRNDENDNDPFFDQMQKRKDALKSSVSVIRHANAKGLDKNEAISEISEATEQGNQSVRLSGIDYEGDVLKGNNDKFQLQKPIEALNTAVSSAAKQLYNTFVSLVQDGMIKLPVVSGKARKVLSSLATRFQND